MKRKLPPQVDLIKNWCLAQGRFKDVDFMIDIKKIMENDQKINANQATILKSIIESYSLSVDIARMMKERSKW